MHKYLLVLLLLTATATGCSTYSTVTVPAGESTVNTPASDTTVLEALPPASIEGTRTEPVEITLFEDTTTRPTVDLSWLEVDRSDPDDQTITARVQQDSTTVETTWKLPEVGEETRLFSDGGGLEGTVFGAPMAHEQDAVTDSIDRPWFYDLTRWLRLLAAVAFGAILSYFVIKLTPL